jgi:predicted  nucleic acid-binding Zn-ribbon protein
MIDENFLQSAVRIRRTYLKLTNNMDFYQKKIKILAENLDKTILRIEDIQKEIETKKNTNPEKALQDLLVVLNEVDEEGKKLESLVDPLNKEIEKLALEEQELYRLIKEKHFNLTDDQIVDSVRTRLIEESLS